MRRVLTAFVVLAAITGAVALGYACGGEGGTKYDVTVQFNESVTQGDLDETAALLRGYDEDLDFIVMEIFPPIGRALLKTDVADFCGTVTSALEAKSYVSDVSCEPWQPVDVDDPDAPVEQTNEPAD